jgi:hypothetical protein
MPASVKQSQPGLTEKTNHQNISELEQKVQGEEALCALLFALRRPQLHAAASVHPDSVVTYDLLHVFRADTLIKADTALYDLIYVYRIPIRFADKTVSDTVYFGNGRKGE